MYVGFLPSSGLRIHPGAKNLNLCLAFRWAPLFIGFDLFISLSSSLTQLQTWEAFPSEGKCNSSLDKRKRSIIDKIGLKLVKIFSGLKIIGEVQGKQKCQQRQKKH